MRRLPIAGLSLPLLAALLSGAEPPPAVVLRHGNTVSAVAFASDGKTLASAGWDNVIRLWDVAEARELRSLTGHTGEIECIAFAPDGKTLVSGAWDRTLRLWDVAEGKELRRFGVHPDGILCVAFAPDGKVIASGNQDRMAKQGTLHLWDAATGTLVRTIVGHSSPVSAVAFAPDGKRLASGSLDRTVRLFDVETGKERAVLEGHREWIYSLAFTPDGKLLASGSGDKTVRLWDVATARQRYLFEGHDDKVRSVAFARDGKTLASGSFDRTVRFWESASGQQRLLVRVHKGGVRGVAFAPNDRVIASGSSDGTVRLADVFHLAREGRPAQETLTEQELAELWTDLGGKDATKAFQAAAVLAAMPKQAVPFVQQRLKEVPAGVGPKRVAQLLADLDSDNFGVRQKATRELAKLGPSAKSALEKIVEENASAEVRRRAQELLDKLKGPVSAVDRLQTLRALEVLEGAGTPEARQALHALAQGPAEAELTLEAKASLQRLDRRTAAKE